MNKKLKKQINNLIYFRSDLDNLIEQRIYEILRKERFSIEDIEDLKESLDYRINEHLKGLRLYTQEDDSVGES